MADDRNLIFLLCICHDMVSHFIGSDKILQHGATLPPKETPLCILQEKYLKNPSIYFRI